MSGIFDKLDNDLPAFSKVVGHNFMKLPLSITHARLKENTAYAESFSVFVDDTGLKM